MTLETNTELYCLHTGIEFLFPALVGKSNPVAHTIWIPLTTGSSLRLQVLITSTKTELTNQLNTNSKLVQVPTNSILTQYYLSAISDNLLVIHEVTFPYFI